MGKPDSFGANIFLPSPTSQVLNQPLSDRLELRCTPVAVLPTSLIYCRRSHTHRQSTSLLPIRTSPRADRSDSKSPSLTISTIRRRWQLAKPEHDLDCLLVFDDLGMSGLSLVAVQLNMSALL